MACVACGSERRDETIACLCDPSRGHRTITSEKTTGRMSGRLQGSRFGITVAGTSESRHVGSSAAKQGCRLWRGGSFVEHRAPSRSGDSLDSSSSRWGRVGLGSWRQPAAAGQSVAGVGLAREPLTWAAPRRTELAIGRRIPSAKNEGGWVGGCWPVACSGLQSSTGHPPGF